MAGSSPTPSPRRYDASGRRRAAEERRLRVLDEAAASFQARGWKATTIARVADAAGVSSELVGTTFGTKASLLIESVRRASYVEHADLRSAVLALHLDREPSLERRLDLVVGLACSVLRLMAPLVPVLHHAADDDSAAREVLRAARARHGETCVLLAEQLTGGPARDGAVDEIYVALLGETYLALVEERGLTLDEYAAWLRRTLATAIAPLP
jgi:AcrR family transcriptional regulator